MTHSLVAIKSVNKSKLNDKLLLNLDSEISILKKLKHINIVALLDSIQTKSNFYLIMEYCSFGDLSNLIRNRKISINPNSKPNPNSNSNNTNNIENFNLMIKLFKNYPSNLKIQSNGSIIGGLNENLVLIFLNQLSSALKFLRSSNLIHRDIKPQNLLLCYNNAENDEIPCLKLADFGFARWLPNAMMADTLCGSP